VGGVQGREESGGTSGRRGATRRGGQFHPGATQDLRRDWGCTVTTRVHGDEVEIYDDAGKLLEVAGPFDDSQDAEIAAERILRLAGE
jgi:hypothetical protein